MANITRKKRISKSKVCVLLALIILLVLGGVLAFKKLSANSSKKKAKNISEIKGYGYVLKDNATAYYKKLFKELSDVLNKKNVDENKYMQLISKMFVADFFNLDNKISKNDVGGKQFVYANYQSDFEKFAMDSMYKSVESNVYGNRKQTLPVVNEVELKNTTNEAYKYGQNTDSNAYVVNFEIEYAKDLGYQKSGSLKIIHNDKKLEIVSMSEKSSN